MAVQIVPEGDGGGLAAVSAPEPTSQTVCAACPHERSAHDRIGTRYCAATVGGGLDRGCVCGSATATSATRWPGPR